MTRELAGVRVRVPGSTSNLGPGFDCLGMAVSRRIEVVWLRGPEPLQVERRGTVSGLKVAPADDLLVRSIGARGAVTGRLIVDSSIPLSRGLGSSASARIAGLLLGWAAGMIEVGDGAQEGARAGARPGAESGSEALEVPRAALLTEAARAEGHPDNVAPALWGGLVAVGGPADALHVTPLPLSPRVGWCYAAPGVEVRTDAARQALPATVPHGLVGATGARLATLQHALATADPEGIAWGMHDEVHSPWRLPLIPGGADAMEAARAEGAWGVAISGSGSGLIAAGPLDRMEAVRAAMSRAFDGRGPADEACSFVCRADPLGATVERLTAAEAAALRTDI